MCAPIHYLVVTLSQRVRRSPNRRCANCKRSSVLLRGGKVGERSRSDALKRNGCGSIRKGNPSTRRRQQFSELFLTRNSFLLIFSLQKPGRGGHAEKGGAMSTLLIMLQILIIKNLFMPSFFCRNKMLLPVEPTIFRP